MSLGSLRVPVKRGSLLPGSLLAGSPSVLSSHQISQERGSPGAHSITRPGADNPPYLLWAGRQGGWCDTPLNQRRDPLGCVPAVLPVVRVPGRERRLLEIMQLAIGEFITDLSQGLPPSPRV